MSDFIKPVAEAIRATSAGGGDYPERAAENAIQAYEDYNDRALGVMVYRGNSVSWWQSKAENYKGALGRAWDALREAGIHPNGELDVAAAIRVLAQRVDAAKAGA